MINDITTIWQGSENEGSLSLTVSFLLAPFNNQKLTSQEVGYKKSYWQFSALLDVLHAVYKYKKIYLEFVLTYDTGAPEVTSQSTVTQW